jgi:D-cysteine desulfhydrase
MRPRRLRLAHLPTPISEITRLREIIGCRVWVKRDDMTGGPEAGNKIRKLEYLLADALDLSAKTVITCGAVQSNHARATAVLAARLGLRSKLFLRRRHNAAPEEDPGKPMGNLFLDKLVGADITFITPEEYRERTDLMANAASEMERRGERTYVIPEGGSNGLGALGYVDAMSEIAEQARLGLCPKAFDHVFFACGSGGTAAGIALGAQKTGIAEHVHAACVCDDAEYFESAVRRIVPEARSYDPDLAALPQRLSIAFDDREKGPSYGVMSKEQRALVIRVARETGLLLDPVYTGKAMAALAAQVRRGEVSRDAKVLFIHTGGLPGLLAESAAFEGEL